MFSNKVEEKVVKDLEKVLKEKYDFPGTFEGIKFNNKTEKAFCQLVEVLENSAKSVIPTPGENLNVDSTPKIGDSAFVYWHGHGWFTATIERWLQDELHYLIRWTDGNWAAERAKYDDLCVDVVPDVATIGVGTKVLFKQGLYYCGYMEDGKICDSTGRNLTEEKKAEFRARKEVSDRWHMGRITSVNGDGTYNGRHVSKDDPQVSRDNYVGYTTTFEGLKLDQLRTLPNVFNCVAGSAGAGADSSNKKHVSCDVFVSKVDQDNSSVRKIISQIGQKFAVSESSAVVSSANIQQTVTNIKTCSVYLVCLSDNFIENPQAMSELLYAKKTAGKTVIPVVIGSSNSWLDTTAGMLLAGQLYISFGSEDVYEEKLRELQSNLEKLVIRDESGSGGNLAKKTPEYPPRVFLSYCWTNSVASFEAGQLRRYVGNCFSDPRKMKADIEAAIGEEVWLDIEQLDSVDDSGMFGQIADGLKDSSIVIMCVSKEYTNSQNCQMEANFALRSLRKEVIVIEIGSGSAEDRSDWMRSSVGMVLPIDHKPFILTPDIVDSEEKYKEVIGQITRRLTETALSVKRESVPVSAPVVAPTPVTSSLSSSVPMVGDAVVAHYAAWQFFPARVVSFEKTTMKYTVDWDDPDPACRVQTYSLVAANVTPMDNMIGIGSSVLFKQGTYSYGGSSGPVWNLGEVTSIEEEGGVKFFSGKHSKTAADGLAVAGWSTFRPTFERALSNDLRLFPNAMEMLQAFKNLQNIA